MKNSALHLTFAVLVLVFGAAFEESLPKFWGVGFPVLLSAVQFSASRWTFAETVLFALAAGAMEDALCGLPVFLSASCFLLVAIAVRRFDLPRLSMLLAYPFYQVWLSVWCVETGGTLPGRLVWALPFGLAAVYAVGVCLSWLERKIAFDEQG